jgi:2-dehydro-3-deoxyphosphogluconate aldolase/(4S)-4-hydroxy-2-oxoglutarate aldolase
MKDEVIGKIESSGVIPVVRAPSAELARSAVDALFAGGMLVVEVTMTIPSALPLIQSLVDRYGSEIAIGAGTVLDAETALASVRAGAAFVVSPVVDERVIACCRTHGVAAIPGALTPTEIVQAARAGADMIKVFPCGALGGPTYIRSLKAPLPDLRLVPTGGVSLQNAGEFIRAGASALGVGANLVDIAKIRDGHAQAVAEEARRYVDAIRMARAKGA